MTLLEKKSVRNRRRAMRKEARSIVRVECRRGALGMGKNISAQFLDISEGGVRITVNKELTFGEEVEVLIFGYSPGKPVKRLANVVWVLPLQNGEYGVGLEYQKRLPYLDVAQVSRG